MNYKSACKFCAKTWRYHATEKLTEVTFPYVWASIVPCTTDRTAASRVLLLSNDRSFVPTQWQYGYMLVSACTRAAPQYYRATCSFRNQPSKSTVILYVKNNEIFKAPSFDWQHQQH